MRLLCVFLVLATVIAIGEATEPSKVSCKDEQNNDVDWWYMYKLPKHYSKEQRGQDTSGLRYLYVTSNGYDNWQLSGRRISDADSMTALTLRPLYGDVQRVLLAAYNDQFPNHTVFSNGGHAKGVIATDGVTGLWLVHSVPKFPSMSEYSYPTTGEQYGQSLLCLTLDAAGIEKVGEILVYNEPHFYYERNPLLPNLPSLERALRQQWRTQAPYQKDLQLNTLGGKEFRIFGKSPRANVELYAGVVAPTLDVSLFVEAWRDGAGNLPNACEQNDRVYNVEQLANEAFSVDFKTTSDHSKWAVSQEKGFKLHRWRIGSTDWTCVGDINRQQHQQQRGGGTVCHRSSRVADLYRKLLAKYENCNN